MSVTAPADHALLGRQFAAGSYVTIRIAAVHRDPAMYDAPHTFDISRHPPKPQLAFGAGRHYCLGAALGKMEVQEMIADSRAHAPVARGRRRRLPDRPETFSPDSPRKNVPLRS